MKSSRKNTITNTTVSHNRIGIYLAANEITANNTIRYSNICENNRYGIYSLITATDNWWGDSTGPHHPEENQVTGEKSGYCEHPALPMSAVLLMCPESGYTEQDDVNNEYNANAFMDWARAWVFIGMLNEARTKYVRRFIETYADRVTDYKYSYERAVDIANEKANGKCEITLHGWGTTNTPFEHITFEDKYRNIDRVIYDELHEKIYEEENKNLEYERDFSGDSNGAYCVFHCWVDGDMTDTSTEADLLIEIFTKEDGDAHWGDSISSDGFDVTNQYYVDEYGGSQICTVYIPVSELEAADTIRAKITHEQGSEAEYVTIQRFEIMEIGM